MEHVLQQLQQFLADEQELLNILARDVADAETNFEHAKMKSLYATQLARVSGIEDSIDLMTQQLGE